MEISGRGLPWLSVPPSGLTLLTSPATSALTSLFFILLCSFSISRPFDAMLAFVFRISRLI